ncbi:MAG: serine hydrolase domain-containing protein [Armatimonadota bacterium]|nr:serine hydrolase domain-containing protein [Armatimonadota bacterium]MDR7485019.1 serine hydrolase domain-containing protein [Armatimonadota bacterium]MDR7534566.1 serine hydrolase domain-containing protein [Armatimonadota bacterium]MDR7535533.1 serine hydrolase domain-containing protein [Armatimonadota bacterium]
MRAAIADGLARGVFPGAVVAVRQEGRWLAHAAFGRAQVVPRPRPMTLDAVFDLASLTKPLATAAVVLDLWSRRRLDLDAAVAVYLPAFGHGAHAAVTVRHLLVHTAGLPAWEPLYLPAAGAPRGLRHRACRTVAEATRRIAATPLAAPPGARVEYSDLGFIALGYLVERVAGEPLDRLVRRLVARPLGLRTLRYRPPASWRCVATETGNAYERQRAAEQGLGARFRWRTHVLRGEVHDGNAWYVGRGVAGHAGLFGTAADVARAGEAWLGGGVADGARLLPAEVIAEATRDHTGDAQPGRRGLGWALAGWPFAGRRASPAAFGHTGFTGTSLLVDPARALVIVLLTNRVHPSASGEAIVAFRPAFHDAVIEACDG